MASPTATFDGTPMATDGLLSSSLLAEHNDVSVLQFTAKLSDDGKLSLSERKGALAPGFAAMRAAYGPELTFGHYMGEALTDDLLLLKVVQGGTDLRVDWKTDCSMKISANDLTAEEKAQESLYDVLWENATKILNPEVLKSHFSAYERKKIEIAGFVWFQGWNDGGKPVNEANYKENLTCLINQLRSDLNLPNLPVVITQTHRGKGNGAVQVAQKQVAEEIGHAELAVTEDLSGYYHFDSAAHLVIGKRMAEAMTPLLPEGTAGECGCRVVDGICYQDCADAPESCMSDDSGSEDSPVTEGLPLFTYQGVALHPDDLDYSPKNDLIHPTIINASEHIQNALGKYYLYYSPHDHIGVSMAYADNLAGPWTEYKNNPVIIGPAAPDIRWIEELGKYLMWAHSNNTHTDLWFTQDGINFQKSTDPGTSIIAGAVDTQNASYTRVYKRGINGLNNKYIMLYSGLNTSTGRRHIWLAHSNNALHWTQLEEPLVEPAAGENGQIYGASYVHFGNRNYIVYQDNSSDNSGGIIKYVEVDNKFTPVGADGERRILLNPPATAPINGRYRGAEFYQDGSTFYLFSGASRKRREIIVYATAEIQPRHWG